MENLTTEKGSVTVGAEEGRKCTAADGSCTEDAGGSQKLEQARKWTLPSGWQKEAALPTHWLSAL